MVSVSLNFVITLLTANSQNSQSFLGFMSTTDIGQLAKSIGGGRKGGPKTAPKYAK